MAPSSVASPCRGTDARAQNRKDSEPRFLTRHPVQNLGGKSRPDFRRVAGPRGAGDPCKSKKMWRRLRGNHENQRKKTGRISSPKLKVFPTRIWARNPAQISAQYMFPYTAQESGRDFAPRIWARGLPKSGRDFAPRFQHGSAEISSARANIFARIYAQNLGAIPRPESGQGSPPTISGRDSAPRIWA